jgi:hypothetical protein
VLKLLYAWLVEEEEIPTDPMARLRPPIVPDKPVPIVPADGLKRLFAVCAGSSFEARRDTALLMLLLDTGARRAEITGLTLDDVDLDLDVLVVLGKGRRERTLPFGRRAGEALDRYLRARTRHKHADQPWLWLGQKGRLTDIGLRMMLRRRGAQAGLPGLHATSSATPSPTSGLPKVAPRPTSCGSQAGSRVPCSSGTELLRPTLVPAKRTGACRRRIGCEGDRLCASRNALTAVRTTISAGREQPSGVKVGVLRGHGHLGRCAGPSPAAWQG